MAIICPSGLKGPKTGETTLVITRTFTGRRTPRLDVSAKTYRQSPDKRTAAELASAEDYAAWRDSSDSPAVLGVSNCSAGSSKDISANSLRSRK